MASYLILTSHVGWRHEINSFDVRLIPHLPLIL